MKKNINEFIRRGLIACGFGPIVLAIIYLILQKQGAIQTLTVNEICLSILSIALLAFVVGGTNVVYQIERLPLMLAVLLHGGILYAAYLATYLVNHWLERGVVPFLVFTAIFVVGYLFIWAVIYSIVKKSTDEINQRLLEKQREEK